MYEEKNLTILEYIILGKFDNYHNIQINYCKSQSLRDLAEKYKIGKENITL